MKRTISTVLFFVFAASAAFAGDSKWWGKRIGGFSFGVGEISNHILIYWGQTYLITPFPSGHKWLILYQIFAATFVLFMVFLIRHRRRKV
jgi:hypothetical protein